MGFAENTGDERHITQDNNRQKREQNTVNTHMAASENLGS